MPSQENPDLVITPGFVGKEHIELLGHYIEWSFRVYVEQRSAEGLPSSGSLRFHILQRFISTEICRLELGRRTHEMSMNS